MLDNTEVPIWEAPAQLGERIQDWKDRPSNIGALERYLLERAERVRYDPFGMPTETTAKSRMIEAGQSDMDKAFDYMLEVADGDIVTPAQWGAFAQQARMAWQLDLPIGDKLQAALTAVIQKRGRRCEGLGGKQIKVKGQPVRPWIIRDFEAWKGNSEHAQIRAEIMKNGDPRGGIVEFPAK